MHELLAAIECTAWINAVLAPSATSLIFLSAFPFDDVL